MLRINHTRPVRKMLYWDVTITKNGRVKVVKAYDNEEGISLCKRYWTRQGWAVESVSDTKETVAIDL